LKKIRSEGRDTELIASLHVTSLTSKRRLRCMFRVCLQAL
jgi:hypothetical protein